MSRRMMGAGLAGSTHKGRGANINQVQFGNKLQGLSRSTGTKSTFSSRAINRRAYGNKRDVVFCVNQLSGGVGTRRGMFASTADGVKDCKPGVWPSASEDLETDTGTGEETSSSTDGLMSQGPISDLSLIHI